ncbi:N-acetylmuramoyl-L-alanine amidase [Lacihabitans soyangensis]|uniref:N-acetylmuramoyl-L-alanine amidase n=1 Tax=Lacihabitans soyangensis TaxID=869394 RepID=A0AAE3KW76_9BACT|nr:N-acetylmuramoyl-L-alanine amidase [Lacihabitans soyangensis]MCP9762415.1 N-acetylmuramoyl-L-alanine amidase [Lacihabitans soyangensis]
MKITNNRLVSERASEIVIQESTTNKGGEITPNFIIIHFTAGRGAESSVAWFKDPMAKASAHLVIGRDGKIYQLVDFNLKAWHAGVSRWTDTSGLNGNSIGIELDNPGRLTKVGDKYLSWFKKEYPKENVIEATHKHEKTPTYWYEYTEAQIESCFEVCKLLLQKYNIQDILGHDDIAPYRKNDPGPIFPMESFRSKLLGREDDTTDIYQVTTDNVNIRRGPNTEFDSYGQLNKGMKVEFIKSENGWSFVYVLEQPSNGLEPTYGWVKGTLLSKI